MHFDKVFLPEERFYMEAEQCYAWCSCVIFLEVESEIWGGKWEGGLHVCFL